MYSHPECEGCEPLKRDLKAKGIPFVERDVAKEERYAKKVETEKGCLIVPVVYVDGTKVAVGYNPEEVGKVEKEYRRRLAEKECPICEESMVKLCTETGKPDECRIAFEEFKSESKAAKGDVERKRATGRFVDRLVRAVPKGEIAKALTATSEWTKEAKEKGEGGR